MEDIDVIVKEMLGTRGIKIQESKKQQDAEEVIKLMLQEVLKHEKKQLSDIKQVGDGGYSSAFQIGSKIIKIGQAPETYEIAKNSKRFLKPLIRHKLELINEEGKIDTISVEITEAVDTNTNVTEEELYAIYKELREEGIIWTDAKSSNVGRLLKPNVPHFKRNKPCTFTKHRLPRRANRSARTRRACYNRFGLHLRRRCPEHYMARRSFYFKKTWKKIQIRKKYAKARKNKTKKG